MGIAGSNVSYEQACEAVRRFREIKAAKMPLEQEAKRLRDENERLRRQLRNPGSSN